MEEHAAVDSRSALADTPPSTSIDENGFVVVTLESAAKAGRAACRAVERLVQGSNLFGETMVSGSFGTAVTAETTVRSIEPSDMILGCYLGRGGFSVVRKACLASEADCKTYYAAKYLHSMAMANKRNFQRGASDLAIEAKLLGAMSHPNIIQLHGVTAGDVAVNFGTGRPMGFFLLLDQLSSTLERRIESWRKLDAKYNKIVVLHRDIRDFMGSGRQSLLEERLGVARDLADALSYLHRRGVAFRDIKPDNVGFDQQNVLKLFDFGLANELKPSRLLPDGTYKLTGNTGSTMYMAPEVAKSMPYNLSADAFSFGIVLWEIWATEKPYRGYSLTKYRECVIEGEHRPSLDEPEARTLWPSRIKDLMVRCWSKEPRSRPDFASILTTVISILEEQKSVSNHNKRRSRLLSLLGGVKTVKSLRSKSPPMSRWLRSEWASSVVKS